MSEPPKREPVAWVIPGDDNAKMDGSLDAWAWQEGEFSRPLYAAPPADHARLVEALAVAREALEIICSKRQCLDNLMGNTDVALAALARIDALQPLPRDEQHEAGSGQAPKEPDAPV